MSKFNIRYITNVEPPRCGNTLLIEYLRPYFEDEWYYCEYYLDCISAPCVSEKTVFQRNHDFELDLPNNPNSHYLIQMRHPVHAIVSHYEMQVKLEKYNDSFENWIAHSVEWLKFFQAFCIKWILNNPYDNFLIISYENMLANPIEVVGNVINFCAPNHELDSERLNAINDSVSIRKVRDPRKFKYYDPLHFALMELEVLDILPNVGLQLEFVYDLEINDQIQSQKFENMNAVQQFYLQKIKLIEPSIRSRNVWNTQTQLNVVIDELKKSIERLQNVNTELLKENLELKKVI
jgi:hypothetical protein